MKLELYHMEQCPYCAKVRKYIDSAHLKAQVAYHEINEHPEDRKKLIDMNGTPQVPCLVIDGKPMLESDEIIDWLKEHKAELH